MFHLRAVDYNIAWRRIENRNKLKWSEAALKKGQGEQNRLDAKHYMQRFFITDPQFYSDAFPPDEFNNFVIGASEYIEKNPYKHVEQSRMVNIPQRFRETVGAVDFSTFDSRVEASRDFSPTELYYAATA